MRYQIIIILGIVFVFFPQFYILAGENALERGSIKTLVDGKITGDEYTYEYKFKDYTLYMNWTGDRVYVGVRTKSRGWIGVGFGSNRMEGAHIIIGYYGDDGNPVLAEQKGIDRTHSDTDEKYLLFWVMNETRNETILEFEVEESSIIKKGQTAITMIIAYGPQDSITTYHGRFRSPISIPLKVLK